MSDQAGLSLKVDDAVAHLTLRRPEAGNSFDLPMAMALRAAVESIATHAGVRAVVISGHGRLFCAGGDVRAMAQAPDRAGYVAELAEVMHQALIALRELPVLILAAVRGAAAGAGLGLVLAADIALATDDASFLTAYAGVGLTPDCGVSALLPAVVGPRRAAMLALTGRRLSAGEALEYGIVSEVCRPDELAERTEQLLRTALATAPAAIGETARLLRRSVGRGYPDQLADEQAAIARQAAGSEARRLIGAFAGSPSSG
jgi:2-(1,2-epoxy-1,2-dihydrophenyl)acetyl-CoA isomerase